MNTYAIITRPDASDESIFAPMIVEGAPTNMTFREANVMCDSLRESGLDVVVYNMRAA